jgi:hypothetical protein
MFTVEERGELSLDFFLSDLKAFRDRLQDPREMTLPEMLDFLTENQ